MKIITHNDYEERLVKYYSNLSEFKDWIKEMEKLGINEVIFVNDVESRPTEHYFYSVSPFKTFYPTFRNDWIF